MRGNHRHMFRLLALILIVIAVPASAETIDGNRIIVLDGDTVALPCATPSAGCAEMVRFVDIDASRDAESGALKRRVH